ncbi:hypothetical protein AAF712_002963 [Marasmius tenuissimus]|uniref:Uncharacterized protein n=1 Tax=Marasmius tenuissimus TaxID=585030 RepID=A0ABR3A9M2_9AGAR
MSDDDIFSALKSPAPGHYPQLSPPASRLIRESRNSIGIKSDFSPSAFEDAPSNGTDATIDQPADDSDDVIVDCDEFTLPESSNEDLPLAAADDRAGMSVAPEAGSSSLVTPYVGQKALGAFDPTPYKKALGRDYSRATIFDKTSIMHLYGGLGVLSLLGGVLHMCHVLPVATSNKLLDQLARGIGEKLININSSLNFWILTPTFHYAVDTGLIKFVPTEALMVAIECYLNDLYELRRRFADGEVTLEEYNKLATDDLQRRKIFPPANYSYKAVGVLCQSGFLIPRHEVDDDAQDFDMPVEDVHNEGTDYEIKIKRFPLPLRRRVKPQDPSNPDQTPVFIPKVARVLRKFRAIDPTVYDEEEVFWLWQDPFFVLMNAGEFIRALRDRWTTDNPHEEFLLDSYIASEEHRKLLERALTLYEAILGAPAPPGSTGNPHESPSRPSRMKTRSKTAPSRAAGKSRASTKKTRDTRATGSQHNAGTKRNASAMDGNESRTEGTRRSRRLKLEEPEPDMDGRTQL